MLKDLDVAWAVHRLDGEDALVFGFITGGGTYKEDKFAEDAQLITDFYRDEGYIMAQVGQPQMKTLEDSADGKTRWIQLMVPITEGKKYAVGDFKFEGNKVVIVWNPADGGITVETFSGATIGSTSMNGVSNRYAPLYAKKA